MQTYSKKGDQGFTHLLGSLRVRKDDPRMEAVGAVDELNCHIGHALSEARRGAHVAIAGILRPIQSELFILGSRLAGLGTSAAKRELPSGTIDRLEQHIDTLSEELPPLRTFILPDGCELACRLQIGRSVCRRAERAVVHLLNPTDTELLHDPMAVPYLNRLSDLLFTLARLANRDANETETPWQSDPDALPPPAS